MKRVKKVENQDEITKYGYIKSIKGEIGLDLQIEHLVSYGVKLEHIYNGDEDQTIFDAIGSLRFDEDQLVAYSGAIVTQNHLKKVNKELGPIPQTLYLCKGEVTMKFTDWEQWDAFFTHIEDIQRRNGGQGGKPPSVTDKDHKRIRKMKSDGLNAKEITAALGWDEGRSTTVWRWAKVKHKDEIK